MKKERKPKQYYIDKMNSSELTMIQDLYKKVVVTYDYKDFECIENKKANINNIAQDYKSGISIDNILEKYKIRYQSFLYIWNRYIKPYIVKNKYYIFFENMDKIKSEIGGDIEKIKKVIAAIADITETRPSIVMMGIGSILFKNHIYDKVEDITTHKYIELIDEDKKQLIEYKKTHTGKDTAKRFNVSPATVYNIIKNQKRIYTAKGKPIEYYQNKLKNCNNMNNKYALKRIIDTYYYRNVFELKNDGVNISDIIEDYRNNITLEELVEKYKIRWNSLCSLIERKNLFRDSAKKEQEEYNVVLRNIDEIRSIVEEGDKEKILKMLNTLADISGRERGNIKIAIGRRLYKMDNPPQLDVFRKYHILTDKEKELLREYRKSHTIKETGEKFSVSKANVCNICKW